MPELELIRNAIKKHQIEWRKHALQRMLERSISRADVIEVVIKGEVIEEYKDDKPFPSALYFMVINNRPLHAVASFDKVNAKVYIITAYEPSLEEFESNFKTRRKK